jgi:putative transposase
VLPSTVRGRIISPFPTYRLDYALDNAMTESFFATLKRELMPKDGWSPKKGARAAVFEWTAVYYNRQLRHSSIGYRTPVEFESSKELPQAA